MGTSVDNKKEKRSKKNKKNLVIVDNPQNKTYNKPPQGLSAVSNDIDIINWDGVTYVPYSYTDDRMATCIVAYDENNKVLGSINKNGVRYVNTIKVDHDIVTLIGEDSKSVTLSWKELISIS